MIAYRHTQRGTLLRWVLGGSLVGLAALRVFALPPEGPSDLILGGVWLAILAALVLMHAMTVTVDERDLVVTAGPGLIRRRIPLADIVAARRARHPWYYGWGLRLTNRGVLWRVAGFNAVEIDLPDGRFSIGTDDPDGLLAALRQEIA